MENEKKEVGHKNFWKEFWRTVKYFIVAASAGLIQFGVNVLLFKVTPMPYWICYDIALVLSVIWNFTLNRHFTFRSAGNVPIAMLKVACYYAVFTPLSTILGNFLAETCGWNGILVTILNMAANLVTEYLYDRYFVFGKTIDTNQKATDSFNNTKDKD